MYDNKLFIYLTWLLLIIVIIVFTVLNFQIFSRIGDIDNDIVALKVDGTSLNDQLTSADAQLVAVNTKITTLEGQVATLSTNATADMSLLKEQLTQANSQITTLSQKLATEEALINTLQSQFATSNSQVTILQSKVDSLQSAEFSLESQVNSLQTTVNSLSNPTTLFSARVVSQDGSETTLVHTFIPTFTGHFRVSGTSSSATGYIRIINNTTGSATNSAFGTGTTLTVAMNAGDSYSVYFGNIDAPGHIITASLTGIYQP